MAGLYRADVGAERRVGLRDELVRLAEQVQPAGRAG
jgi:hypothetical protein